MKIRPPAALKVGPISQPHSLQSNSSIYQKRILSFARARGLPRQVKGAGLRTLSRRGSWVQIPPPALNMAHTHRNNIQRLTSLSPYPPGRRQEENQINRISGERQAQLVLRFRWRKMFQMGEVC